MMCLELFIEEYDILAPEISVNKRTEPDYVYL